VLDHPGEVVAEGFEAEGAVDVAGVAVGLQLDGDDLSLLRQLVEHLPRKCSKAIAAVGHDEGGPATAAALPVPVDNVDRRVPSCGMVGHLVFLVVCW
jgi:hypothetical protein